MSDNLFLILVIAFVLIVLAIACLAIGWLITGRTKIERGTCGHDLHHKRHEGCDDNPPLPDTHHQSAEKHHPRNHHD